MALDIDSFHHVMDTSMNATAVLFNLYLLYLIKYYSTTFEVKLYPILLSIDCSLDLLLAISAFLAQPVVFTANGYYVAFSNGFFTGRSAWLDCFFISVFCFFLHANIIWIPVQFVYRYRLFSPELSKSSKVNLLIVTVALAYSTVATVVIVDFFRIFEDTQEIGQHILDMNGWPMESAVDKHLVVYYIKSWRMYLWIALWTFTCTVSIIIVVLCEKGIMRNYTIGILTNPTTQKLHSEFHRALLAMAICPVITSTVPVLYFMFTIGFQLCPGRISILMIILLTSITVLNPITTLLCFRCYRQAAARSSLSLITFGRYKSRIKSATGQTGGAKARSAVLGMSPAVGPQQYICSPQQENT